MLRESHAGPGDSVGREVWYLHQYRHGSLSGVGGVSSVFLSRLGLGRGSVVQPLPRLCSEGLV